MQKDIRRALRRHHTARLKQARQRYWGRLPLAEKESSDYRLAWTPVALGSVVNTPTNCSCILCGNARKWFGHATLKELRDSQESIEQLLSDC